MKLRKNEKGALFIEAAIVLPFMMIFMLLFVYLINIFVVQSLVQYGLNQTVNELGNYTYYLNYIGLIDASNNTNDRLKKATDQLQTDINNVNKAFNDLTGALNKGHETIDEINTAAQAPSADNIKACVSGVIATKNSVITAKDSITTVWNTIKDYAKNPSKLFEMLKSQALLEIKDAGHSLVGGLLGKAMMDKYVSSDFLTNCGVVSTTYNGKMSSDEYLTGISGMDFTGSNFLGDDDSRVIDIVVVYRIKFPFNLSGMTGAEEGPLYDNSLLIVQRAVGYGWINGDNSGDGKYNGVDKKGLKNAWS